MKKIPVLLLISLLLFSGCSKKNADSVPQETKAVQTAENKTDKDPEMGDIHITVESPAVTESELKAMDYTVPVRISLDQNSGLMYSEWGVFMDERCTFEVDEESEEPVIAEYCSVNNDTHSMWTAWASGREDDPVTGVILVLSVTLPEDAAAGDVYTIKYADKSIVDKPHAWQTKSHDWAAEGSVTWTDGEIRVVSE